MSEEVLIRLSLWDSGCLPEVLRRAIEEVERHERATGSQFSSYLRQLRACQKAVQEAHHTPPIAAPADAERVASSPARMAEWCEGRALQYPELASGLQYIARLLRAKGAPAPEPQPAGEVEK